MERGKRAWKARRADFNGSGLAMAHITSIYMSLTRVHLTKKETRQYSITAKDAGRCSPTAKGAGRCSLAQEEDNMVMVNYLLVWM